MSGARGSTIAAFCARGSQYRSRAGRARRTSRARRACSCVADYDTANAGALKRGSRIAIGTVANRLRCLRWSRVGLAAKQRAVRRRSLCRRPAGQLVCWPGAQRMVGADGRRGDPVSGCRAAAQRWAAVHLGERWAVPKWHKMTGWWTIEHHFLPAATGIALKPQVKI